MHLALICPDLTGHLNPMTTLGQALRRRGHRVSLVSMPESRAKAEAAGFELLPIGVKEQAAGLPELARAKLGRLRGVPALRFTGQMLCRNAIITLRDAPAVVANADVDGVLVDQITPGGTVADLLNLPFVLVCNALALHQEPAVPPPVLGWPPLGGPLGRLRNRIGNGLLTTAARPIRAVVDAHRRRHGLRAYRRDESDTYGLAQIAQQPAFFDFPRERLPDHFHYTGPWHAPGRDASVDFPWHRLDGRPIVYASLGTLQNRLHHLFAAIAGACAGGDVQLVAALGRPDADTNLAIRWPPGAVVVPYAPQLELIRRATAVITHGGLNTTLETLAAGVPMVAIPLTNDQPGVARRAARLGAAVIVPPARANAANLRLALRRVLCDVSFRRAAERCRDRMRMSPTVETAAVIAEHAIKMRTRLTRADAGRLGLTPTSLDGTAQ
jgi:MGT family glycosyltransferase